MGATKWRRDYEELCDASAGCDGKVLEADSYVERWMRGTGSIGVGRVEERDYEMKLWLIRHGMTKGNREHRYVGVTDEGILPEEKERLQARAAEMDLHPAIVFVSPARRCRETAECLFPGAAPALIVVPEFMEMNFGAFEYMSWQEINQDPDSAHRAAYQRYIDSGGETAFPGGESKAEFTRRVCDGFERAMLPRMQALMPATDASVASEIKAGTEREIVFKLQDPGSTEDARSECSGEDIAIVAHGGTIMALMERYAEPHKPYFEWSVKPGEGFQLDLKNFVMGSDLIKCYGFLSESTSMVSAASTMISPVMESTEGISLKKKKPNTIAATGSQEHRMDAFPASI